MKLKLFLILFFTFFSFNSLAENQRIVIASTTSTYDTGLLKELNNQFFKKFKTEVHVLSLGTGQAIRTAKDGNAEILLVHHKPSEIDFMKNKYGLERYEFMYNDYVIVGPINDNMGCETIEKKINNIFKKEKLFISRDDDSGTHKKEIELWNAINLDPSKFNDWYIKIGQGMGKTLLFTNEKKGYTISDRSTWLSFNKRENLKIICENQPPLFNQYSIILVNPKLNKNLNFKAAQKYINWIRGTEAKKIINNFKKNGNQLFFYNYKN